MYENRHYYRRQNPLETFWANVPGPVKEALGWLLALSLFGCITYLAAEAGGKLTIIVTHNPGFWVVIVVSFIFGLYRKVSNPQNFTWRELPIQLLISFVAIVLIYSFFFVVGTDITDKEIRNGYIYRAEYWEEWTERVPCSHTKYCTDSNGKSYACGTEHAYDERYHPPIWKLRARDIDDLSVSQGVYKNYVARWGGHKKEHIFRPSQISFGDGNMFHTDYNNNPELFVPASEEYSYINYLQASKQTIQKRQISQASDIYAKFKRSYPRVYQGNLGPIEVDRIVTAEASVPTSWSVALDKELDTTLATLGKRRQVNILLYLVGSTDVGAGMALAENWTRGKKNDVLVFIGIVNFPKVEWVYISAWTDNEEFKIELRNRLKELGKEGFGNPSRVAREIIDQIEKPDPHGFKRKPMAELEYLVSDIQLPAWLQVLIVLLVGFINWKSSEWLIRERVL